MKSQRDSSFPADGHKAILNKMNNKSKTNRKRTNIDNYNKPQQKLSLATVSNKLFGGLNQVLRALKLALGSAVVHIHIQVVRPRKELLLINKSKQ